MSLINDQFICDDCAEVVDNYRKITDTPKQTHRCPCCGRMMRKLFGGSFILKGSWPGKDIKNNRP